MITIPGTSQHTAGVAGVAWLVEMDFSTGLQRVTTAPVTIVEGGRTWIGVGTLGSVSAVSESEEVIGDNITVSLSIVDRAMVAAVLGNVESYRGRRITLYLQLFNEQFQPVGTRAQRWSGVMEKVSINRQPGNDGSTGSIDLMCSRRSLSRMRNEKGLRLTMEQHKFRFPGDTGLRYIRPLIENPDLWLSKGFQAKLK